MSHFTVVVCLKSIDDLETALAPFDENTEVEPYRDYNDGEPEDYWAVASLRASGRLPEEGPYTWQQIVEAVNAEWPDDPQLQIDENGKPYHLTKYNPLSKWDWWSIGGRWSGYFDVKPEAIGNELIVRGDYGGAFGSANTDVRKCDGGPKGALDLDGMRQRAGEKAGQDYDDFYALAGHLMPTSRMWSYYLAQVDAKEITIDEARELYRKQPIFAKFNGTAYAHWYGDVIEFYSQPREVIVANAQAQAVPGYAILTLDGRWWEPGKMGWWGMSTDTEGSRGEYREMANDYLDVLADDVILVAVDCHI